MLVDSPPGERRRGSNPSGHDSEGRAHQIVQEAARLFDSAGYHSASMTDIAEAVGIAKPTLYHYFKRKSDILFQIHQDFVGLLTGRQRDRMSAGLSPEESLRGVVGDIIEFIRSHHSHVRVFFEHQRELSPDQQSIVSAQRAGYRKAVASIITDGVASGVFQTSNTQLATLAILGMCNWIYRSSEAWILPTDELSSFYADMAIRALAGQPSHG